MNSEDNKFWVNIWTIASVVIIVLILSFSSCQMYKANKISKAISQGVDPLEASLAFTVDNQMLKIVGLMRDK